MPKGGGTFTVQNKVLPGAYVRFLSSGNPVAMGERGIAALALELDWGPENQVYSIDAGDFNQRALTDLGFDPTAAQLLLVREALKRASKLLIYRVNSGGAKATATVGGLTVTAKYGGIRGNDLKVAIVTNVDDDSMVDIVTYLDSAEVDVQTVAKAGGAASLIANDYITFGTAETLTAAAAVSLSGGANGAVNGGTEVDRSGAGAAVFGNVNCKCGCAKCKAHSQCEDEGYESGGGVGFQHSHSFFSFSAFRLQNMV